MVKKSTYNYEIMCILPEKKEVERKKLIAEIQELVKPVELESKLENKKLAYEIGDLATADYLLLNFNTSPEKIRLIEKIIQHSFVIRYLLINLDTETKIKIREKKAEENPNEGNSSSEEG